MLKTAKNGEGLVRKGRKKSRRWKQQRSKKGKKKLIKAMEVQKGSAFKKPYDQNRLRPSEKRE